VFKDIDIFVAAAQAIWSGGDPYHLPGMEVFYPLPFYFLFLPLAWLPPDVTHVLWGVISGAVLVALLRRRALVVMFSSQAVLTFVLGQVDILMMALYALTRSGAAGGGIALAFLLLKPQLALLLAPFLLWRWSRQGVREVVRFGAVTVVLFGASFLAQPDWAFALWERSGERVRAAVSSSLWGVLSFLPPMLWLGSGALIALALVVWAWRTRDTDTVQATGLFISPFIFAYNLMPLYVMFGRAWVLTVMVALSWVGFFIADAQSNDRASALVTVFALAVLYHAQRGRTAGEAKAK
jgi:hypothetical protein